jgi:hypothetical protein
MRAVGRGGLAVAAIALAVAVAPVAALAQHEGHGHGGETGSPPPAPAKGKGKAKAKVGGKGKIGLLIADHGEPPVYNAQTYESFRAFIEHLMEMGVIPAELKAIDTGTILQDPDCFACSALESTPPFINAWVESSSPPAVWSPGYGEDLPPHRFLPGGRGQGEPDIFEHGGLTTWNEWRLLGGTSPNYAQKLAKKQAVIKRLKRRYGKRLVVSVGYGIDPRIDGGVQDLHAATHSLMDAGVSRIVVVYHGVGFSDLMQTHMIRHRIEHTVSNHGSTTPVSYASQMGFTRAYQRSVVKKARAELAQLPPHEPVAIHLSGHGIPTTDCGSYACGSDPYHANSAALFDLTSRSLRKAIRRPGRTGIFRLYGDGATDADDPGELVDSPTEALEKRRAEGFRYVIDIPYEFDSDSRDTLIVLREGYERPIPDWDASYESRFEYAGIQVRITNASFGRKLKTRALERVARRGIEIAIKGD